MPLQPLICVHDVDASSRWYQRLLGCQRRHSGAEYERLNSNGRPILQLHRWEVEHDHGPIGDPGITPGNGLLLWFELEHFDAAVARAEEMNAGIIKSRHRSENAHWECWLHDPDGYVVVLASPHGTAGQPVTSYRLSRPPPH